MIKRNPWIVWGRPAGIISFFTCLTLIGTAPAWPGGRGGGSGGKVDNAPYSLLRFAWPDAITVSSEVADINEFGSAVGRIEFAEGINHAVCLDIVKEEYTLLKNGYAATAINNLNQIVGVLEDGTTPAFWSHAQADPTSLLQPGDDSSAYPFAINDDGLVVGESQGRGVAWRVVVDASGVVHVNGPVELPPLSVNATTQARDLNELLNGSATVLGNSDFLAVTWTITLNQDGTLAAPSAAMPVGTLGDSWSEGSGINSFADVSGRSNPLGSTTFGVPFLAKPGESPAPLPVPRDTNYGIAFDLNDFNQIVGSVRVSVKYEKGPNGTGPGVEHAWFWNNDTGVDLNKQIPSGTGWELIPGTVVSNDGLIGGWGAFNGDTNGFVLIPSGWTPSSTPQ